MKLTNNKYYFDFNATSPLAKSVKTYLAKGDFSFANPSSIHSLGKKAAREIASASDYILDLFQLGNTHSLFYNSGATEANNSAIRGFVNTVQKANKTPIVYYFSTDHASIFNVGLGLRDIGVQAKEIAVDDGGSFDLKTLIDQIKQEKGEVLLCYSWVNNETGVVWPLEIAEEIKKQTNCFVLVDAVQAPGKISEWKKLNSNLDMYTFSAHKFGALKNIGFTIYKNSISPSPILLGGGQQSGHRPGTLNALGIESIRLALSELDQSFDACQLKTAKELLEMKLKSSLSSKFVIVGENAGQRNLNTINFLMEGERADALLINFDMAGLFVSTGSACSSGVVGPSRVLRAMGFRDDAAKSGIRLSFSPYMNEKEAEEYANLILNILQRY